MARKKISIGSWAYTIGPYASNPVPFEEVVRKLKELNFDGVELGGFPPHPNPDDCPDDESRARVKGLVQDAGLEFSGLAANLWSNKLFSVPDNSALLDDFDRNVKFCQDIGIDIIRIDTLETPKALAKVDYQAAKDRVIKTFHEMARRAQDAGLRVCWEFEPGFAFNKPSEVIEIIDGVAMPNFGALYDTCHANMVAKVGAMQLGEPETLPGGAAELAQKLKGKITHLHLIDSDDTCHKSEMGEDETSSHPPFGEGNMNFDELVPVLLDANVSDDWWCIDLCFWPNAWEATAKCKTYLDELRTKFNLHA